MQKGRAYDQKLKRPIYLPWQIEPVSKAVHFGWLRTGFDELEEERCETPLHLLCV